MFDLGTTNADVNVVTAVDMMRIDEYVKRTMIPLLFLIMSKVLFRRKIIYACNAIVL